MSYLTSINILVLIDIPLPRYLVVKTTNLEVKTSMDTGVWFHHFFRRDSQLIFTLVRVILVKKR